MPDDRKAYLDRCKTRALEILDTGDVAGAFASMTSDLNKADPPLYDQDLFRTLWLDGALFQQNLNGMRRWIEGFN